MKLGSCRCRCDYDSVFVFVAHCLLARSSVSSEIAYMSFNLFCRRRNKSLGQGRCKVTTEGGQRGKRIEGAACGKGGQESWGAPNRVAAVGVPRKRSVERKGWEEKRVLDYPAVNARGKVYPLTRNVANGGPAKMDWEQVDVPDLTGPGEYLETDHFGVFPVKGSSFCISSQVQIRLTAYGAYGQRDVSWIRCVDWN